MTIDTLEKLLAPMSVDEFLADYLGKKPVHIPGDPEKFKAVMDWEVLNELLRRSESWTAENFRIVKGSDQAPPPAYCRVTPPSEMRQVMRPAWDMVQQHLKGGATMALYFIQSMTDGLRGVTRALEEGVAGRVQMNLYCSWVREQGLAPHFDTHDVFALHIEGRKKWRVLNKPIDRPIGHEMFAGANRKRLDAQPRKPLLEPVLEPGSLLYIPRGYYHSAVGETDSCFHVAAGVHYPVGLDALNLLWPKLGADPAFRSKLQGAIEGGGEDALATQLEEMAEAAVRIMRDPAFRKDLASIRDNFRTEKFPAALPDAIVGPGRKT